MVNALSGHLMMLDQNGDEGEAKSENLAAPEEQLAKKASANLT